MTCRMIQDLIAERTALPNDIDKYPEVIDEVCVHLVPERDSDGKQNSEMVQINTGWVSHSSPWNVIIETFEHAYQSQWMLYMLFQKLDKGCSYAHGVPLEFKRIQWKRVPVCLDSETGYLHGKGSQLYFVVDGQRYDIDFNEKELGRGPRKTQNGIVFDRYERLVGSHISDIAKGIHVNPIDEQTICTRFAPPFVYVMQDFEDTFKYQLNLSQKHHRV